MRKLMIESKICSIKKLEDPKFYSEYIPQA